MNKEELIKLSRENLRKSKQGSLCECYDEAFIKGYELSKKRIAELEKENAELIHENARLVTVIDKSKSCGISPLNYLIIKNLDDQLTKAKEEIRSLYSIIQYRINYENNIEIADEMWRAKQFLKDNEVEK